MTTRTLPLARALAAGAVITLAASASVLTAALPASAATFTVTSLDDSGPGTLRQAILDANAAPGPDVVTFGVTGTITLASTIDITDSLTITGPGSDALTVNADSSTYLLFQTGSGTDPLDIEAGPDVEFSGMTLDGGPNVILTGVYSSATRSLTLREVDLIGTVQFNAGAVGFGTIDVVASRLHGAYLQLDGVTNDVTIEDITVDGQSYIYATSATSDVTLRGIDYTDIHGYFSLNVYNTPGTVTVDDVHVAGQFSGIYVSGADGGGTHLSVTDSSFQWAAEDGMSSGGTGLYGYNLGSATVQRTSFTNVYQPIYLNGVYSFDPPQGDVLVQDVTVVGPTFSGNPNGSGIGVFQFANVAIERTTISDVYQAVRFQSGPTAITMTDTTISDVVRAVESYANPGTTIDMERVSVIRSAKYPDIDTSPLFAMDGTRVTFVDSTVDIDPAAPQPTAIFAGYLNEPSTEGDTLAIAHSTIVGGEGLFSLGYDSAAEVPSVRVTHSVVTPPMLEGEFYDSRPNVLIDHSAFTASAADLESFDAVELGDGNLYSVTDEQLALDPLTLTGLTPTRRPAPGSILRDAGDPAVTGAPTTDQRGLPRIVDVIDIGAVELNPGWFTIGPDVTVDGGSDAAVTVTRTPGQDADALSDTVAVGFTAGSGVAGQDFVDPGTVDVVFAPGQSTATVALRTIAAAPDRDGRTVVARLAGTPAAPIGDPPTATITIRQTAVVTPSPTQGAATPDANGSLPPMGASGMGVLASAVGLLVVGTMIVARRRLTR